VGGPDTGRLGPVLGGTVGVDCYLGQGVTGVSSSVLLPHLRLLFRCKTLCIEI
jgi:hypothetical protein